MIEYIRGRAFMLLPVSEEDAAVLRAIDQAWTRIQETVPAVPPVIAELTPGRSSSCTAPGWAAGETAILAVNLMPGGRKITGADLTAWLAHHAAHSQALPTTASEGRWHGYSFASTARELGLDAGTGSTGFSTTTLSPDGTARYASEIAELDKALRSWVPVTQPKAERTSRNGVAATCQCSPPRKIRVSEKTFDLGPVLCGICGKPFVAA
jgi:hypothetical protein